MSKRPHSSLLESSILASATKRSRIFEDTVTSANLGTTPRLRSRFWTSNTSSWYPSYRHFSTLTSSQLIPSFPRETRQQQPASPQQNLFSVPPRLGGSRAAVISYGRTPPSKDFRRSANAAGSETKRILLDLERLGSEAPPARDLKRAWFKSIPVLTTSTIRERPNAGDSGLTSSTATPSSQYRPEDNVYIRQQKFGLHAPAVYSDEIDNVSDPIVGTTSTVRNDQPALLSRGEQQRSGLYPATGFTGTLQLSFSLKKPSMSFKFRRPSPIDKWPSTTSLDETPSAGDSALPTAEPTQSKANNDEASTAANVGPISIDSGFPKPTIQSSAPVDGELLASGSVSKTPTAFQFGYPPTTVAVARPETGAADFKTPEKGAQSKWSCSTCFISNEPTASVCICCKTAKPQEKAKWGCPTCFVSNEPAATECACCKTPKPKPKPKLYNQEKWSCPACFVSNEPSASDCRCCKTANPNRRVICYPSKEVVAKSSVESSSIDLEKSRDSCVSERVLSSEKPLESKAPEYKTARWSCTTCFLTNAPDKMKCVCCNSPKPGATFKPVPMGRGLFDSRTSTATDFVSKTIQQTVAPFNGQREAVERPTAPVGDFFSKTVQPALAFSTDQNPTILFSAAPTANISSKMVQPTVASFGDLFSKTVQPTVASSSDQKETVQPTVASIAGFFSNPVQTTVSSSSGQMEAVPLPVALPTKTVKPAVASFGNLFSKAVQPTITSSTNGQKETVQPAVASFGDLFPKPVQPTVASNGQKKPMPPAVTPFGDLFSKPAQLTGASSNGQQETVNPAPAPPTDVASKPIQATVTPFTIPTFGEQKPLDNVFAAFPTPQQKLENNQSAVPSTEMVKSVDALPSLFGKPSNGNGLSSSERNQTSGAFSSFVFGQQAVKDNAPSVSSFGPPSLTFAFGQPASKDNGTIVSSSSQKDAGIFTFGQSTLKDGSKPPSFSFGDQKSTGGFVFDQQSALSSNPFSLTNIPTAKSATERRQLVAKRKIRRP